MASEQKTKWYDPATLQPVYEVPSAKGDKMVNVTLRQARPRRFLPSVTSVIDLMASWSLQEWISENLIKTCAAYPLDVKHTQPVPEDVMQGYIDMIVAKANEYRDHTADVGKAIHKDVELFFQTEGKTFPSDPVSQDIVTALHGYVKEHEITDIQCERGFGSEKLGYAGTPDLSGKKEAVTVIIDLKTTDLDKFKTPYDKWKLQLGGYLGADEGHGEPELIQAVADRTTGEVQFIPLDNPRECFEAFQNLFNVWCFVKGYDPRKG